MKDQNIIEITFTHLQNELGKAIQIKTNVHENKDLGYDAVFVLNGIEIYVEAKNEIRPIQVEQLNKKKGKR